MIADHSKAILKVARTAHAHQEARAIKKLGFGVPFSSLDLAVWLAQKMQGDGAWQCTYCRKMLVLGEVELDHKRPVALGGSFDVQNLCVACKLCNQGKGELTDVGYHRLLGFLERDLEYAEGQYVLKCLRTAAMGARMRFFPRTKKPNAGPASAQPKGSSRNAKT